jgi:hypothetical protein
VDVAVVKVVTVVGMIRPTNPLLILAMKRRKQMIAQIVPIQGIAVMYAALHPATSIVLQQINVMTQKMKQLKLAAMMNVLLVTMSTVTMEIATDWLLRR